MNNLGEGPQHKTKYQMSMAKSRSRSVTVCGEGIVIIEFLLVRPIEVMVLLL